MSDRGHEVVEVEARQRAARRVGAEAAGARLEGVAMLGREGAAEDLHAEQREDEHEEEHEDEEVLSSAPSRA